MWPLLFDPELIQQRPPLRVVLVVPDPLRDEVDDLPVVGRHHRRLREDLALVLLPERAGGWRILRLRRRGAGHLSVDRAIAEPAWVGVRRSRARYESCAGEQVVDEADV